jgi:hypothetical protein
MQRQNKAYLGNPVKLGVAMTPRVRKMIVRYGAGERSIL